jgi:hypothetical protein
MAKDSNMRDMEVRLNAVLDENNKLRQECERLRQLIRPCIAVGDDEGEFRYTQSDGGW